MKKYPQISRRTLDRLLDNFIIKKCKEKPQELKVTQTDIDLYCSKLMGAVDLICALKTRFDKEYAKTYSEKEQHKILESFSLNPGQTQS